MGAASTPSCSAGGRWSMSRKPKLPADVDEDYERAERHLRKAHGKLHDVIHGRGRKADCEAAYYNLMRASEAMARGRKGEVKVIRDPMAMSDTLYELRLSFHPMEMDFVEHCLCDRKRGR